MSTRDDAAPINKTMDRGDLDTERGREIAGELNELITRLRRDGLPVSSWYGEFDLSDDPKSFERINRGYGYSPLPGAVDDKNFPWFLYWEIAWLTINSGFNPGQRLLDLGGSCSLFSYYAASKGLDVTTVELRPELVDEANEVAKKTGWRLTNRVMDMRELDLEPGFDQITSVCVFEHIPISGRTEVTTQIRELLKPGGRFSITFDYKNASRLARISSDADIKRQFVEPSGLSVVGNETFHDNGERYLLHPFFHPHAWRARWKSWYVRTGDFRLRDIPRLKRANDYTFGALFLRKDEEN
jgi:2-polyprenyl-3-methyl-5-hydroxy-6-metoxy-1,4-benzoquinol methylase